MDDEAVISCSVRIRQEMMVTVLPLLILKYRSLSQFQFHVEAHKIAVAISSLVLTWCTLKVIATSIVGNFALKTVVPGSTSMEGQ